MEVTPELYAWLTSLNIIDCVKSLKNQKDVRFIIPDRSVELLMGGKYWDIILLNLQEIYNKFYKLKLNYVDALSQLKPINEDEEYISNSVKFSNLHILNDVLSHFGILHTEDQILSLANGNRDLLNEILTKVFNLTNELLKRSDEPNSFDLGKNANRKRTSFSGTRMSTTNQNMGKPGLLGFSSLPQNKAVSDTLNLNLLSPNKEYDKCDSALEFFIVSLCKNFELKIKQGVALLSNNRKYLSMLCNKGFRGKYTTVLNWIQDMSINSRQMIRLLTFSGDGIGIGFSIVGTALSSKNTEVVTNTGLLISKVQCELGCDWEWFSKEGLDSLIFAIIKHSSIRSNVFKLLNELIKGRMTDFLIELKKKFKTKNKKKYFAFFSESLSTLKEINQVLFSQLKNILFEICFEETEDKAISVSLLCDAWFYFDPIENQLIDNIIHYIKKCIRDKSRGNVSSAALLQCFSLMQRFGKIKKESAPVIYKNLIFFFLENYDNELKRELILINFEKFFSKDKQVPIDLLIDPYLKQIKAANNYLLCDFMFLFKMVEHPRVIGSNIKDIIELILDVSLQNLIYSRTANLILKLIFDKKLIVKLCTEEETSALENTFIEYIKNMLNLFIANLATIEDKAILETPHDIIIEKNEQVNANIHDCLFDTVKEYRKTKGMHSNSLLAMLWQFDNNDEYLLQLEEMFRIEYEPVEVIEQKQKDLEMEKNKKDFKKKTAVLLEKLQQKNKKKRKGPESKAKGSNAKLNKLENNKSSIDNSNSKDNKNDSKLLDNIIREEYKSDSKEKSYLKGDANANAKEELLFRAKTKSDIQDSKTDRPMQDDSLIPRNKQGIEKTIQHETKYESHPQQKLKKSSSVMNINRRKDANAIRETNKAIAKQQSLNELIKDEGSIIKKITISQLKKQAYITSDVYKNFILPVPLEDEEDREIRAIEGYNHQYKKNVRLYFRTYSNEVTQLMSKSNLLKMFRDKGYEKSELTLDELTISIRNIFGDNLNEIDYEQFCSLLIQLSFLIYNKRRNTMTISECYGNLLRHFVPNSLTEATIALNKKMRPVINLIKQKLRHPIDDTDSDFNMPPGFNITEKTSVVYNCRLAPHFLTFMSEAQYISYELIEEIIFNCFNSSTLEPYVKITKTDEIEINPGMIKPWSKDLTISFLGLSSDYEESAVEVTDCMYHMLKTFCKGRDKMGLIKVPPLIEKEQKEAKEFKEIEESKEETRLQRQKEIKAAVEEFRKEKQQKKLDQEKKKKEEKLKRIRELQERIKETKEENQKKFDEIKEKKKAIEEEKHNKLIENQEKEKEELKQKLIDKKLFFDKEKRRLKEQFKMIKNQKEIMYKMQYDSLPSNQKIPEVGALYLEKDKAYCDFERKLNTTMKQLIQREDIMAVFNKYQSHLKVIYDIYSRIGYNKISFYSKESIHLNEFKEFLVNFTVLGLLINTDQMNNIFKKITYESEKSKEDQDTFTSDDLNVSIGYLAIMARFANRSRRILPIDIDNTTPQTFESFFAFLGFKLPFNRRELEAFINNRRSLTTKNLLKIQRVIKKEKVIEFKKSEFEKELQQRKENRRIKYNELYQKRLNNEKDNLDKSENQKDS